MGREKKGKKVKRTLRDFGRPGVTGSPSTPSRCYLLHPAPPPYPVSRCDLKKRVILPFVVVVVVVAIAASPSSITTASSRPTSRLMNGLAALYREYTCVIKVRSTLIDSNGGAQPDPSLCVGDLGAAHSTQNSCRIHHHHIYTRLKTEKAKRPRQEKKEVMPTHTHRHTTARNECAVTRLETLTAVWWRE
ncbi:hypothetical protein O3P69_006993 [Scylla paramamosain]|uniref:Uncharacterized protein n=1 Tax=Scylla paramamosain TaxID=85552 RepID=A0AAW0V3S3_SCYPA